MVGEQQKGDQMFAAPDGAPLRQERIPVREVQFGDIVFNDGKYVLVYEVQRQKGHVRLGIDPGKRVAIPESEDIFRLTEESAREYRGFNNEQIGSQHSLSESASTRPGEQVLRDNPAPIEIDRRVAFQCSIRWALAVGLTIGILFAFLSTSETSLQNRSGSGANSNGARTTFVISCPNLLGQMTSSNEWKALSSAGSEACAEATPWVFLDAALLALIWALILLGLAYLINRNRFVINDSYWFPFRY